MLAAEAPAAGIGHGQQLDEMVVDGRRGRLHEENLFAPNRLAKLYHHFAVGEPVDCTGAGRYAQLTCNRRPLGRIGCTCQNRKLVAHAYLRLPDQAGLGEEPTSCLQASPLPGL